MCGLQCLVRGVVPLKLVLGEEVEWDEMEQDGVWDERWDESGMMWTRSMMRMAVNVLQNGGVKIIRDDSHT